MLLLLSCSPAPEIPSKPEIPEGSEPWILVGRITGDGLDLPPHPDGPAALDPRCASQGLHPCSSERWTDGVKVVNVVRAGHDLRIDGLTGRTDWLRIGPTLMGCLGDPLAMPPADDPGGSRTFDGEWWTLHLSGTNPCRVSGDLRLHAWNDQADWRTLAVDGVPWDAGGRQRLSADHAREPTATFGPR